LGHRRNRECGNGDASEKRTELHLLSPKDSSHFENMPLWSRVPNLMTGLPRSVAARYLKRDCCRLSVGPDDQSRTARAARKQAFGKNPPLM
jgi:hypothetical protein